MADPLVTVLRQLSDKSTCVVSAVLSGRPITHQTYCWMVFLWRAIVLNGMPVMHLNILRLKKATTIQLGWHLLCLRVWAAAEDCARYIHPAQHRELCASVYSGQPAAIFMPPWAKRGMVIPFIFDIMYMVGVNFCDGTTINSVLSANFVYEWCFSAILHENTPEDAFINGDSYFSAMIGANCSDKTKIIWADAFDEYAAMTRVHIMSRPVAEHPTTVQETIYGNLLAVLYQTEITSVRFMFDSVYKNNFNLLTSTSLDWESFYV